MCRPESASPFLGIEPIDGEPAGDRLNGVQVLVFEQALPENTAARLDS